MKNGLQLFLGVFATLALSWVGLLLTAHQQIGRLSQFKDPVDETLYPQPLSGLAVQGSMVYQDLGCVSCHTQQVRREGFGADLGRKWGQRGSYARDYIRDEVVLIGQSRLGPDLRNAGNLMELKVITAVGCLGVTPRAAGPTSRAKDTSAAICALDEAFIYLA
jgi:cytochrome c oxidase cbb3-type subunit 2